MPTCFLEHVCRDIIDSGPDEYRPADDSCPFLDSGQFIKDLRNAFGEREDVILSEIRNRDGIYNSIAEFFGKGR